MRKFLNILMNTVVLFIMSVAISHTASERSGMLACNPNDETQKPVIYAFDGKHLIKDNDPTTPYKYLSSISDQFDVYFAFVPTDDYKEKSARFNKAKSFVTNNYEAINKVISMFISMLKTNFEMVSSRTINPYKDLSLDLTLGMNYSAKTLWEWQNKIEINLNSNKEIKTLKVFEFKTKASEIDSIIEKNLPMLNTDFHHVKLTLDFEEMRVIEQSSLRKEKESPPNLKIILTSVSHLV